MDKKPSPQNKPNLFQSIYEFVYGSESDIENMPLHILENDLKEEGIDPDALYQSVLANVKKKQAQMRLDEAGKLKECLVNKLSSNAGAFIDALPKNKEELLRLASELIGSGNAQLAFRGYENATEEDLRTLIGDMLSLQKIREKK